MNSSAADDLHRTCADDVVMLRRYMVDFGLLERTPSGSTYSRHHET
ncbi:DUF2087 domain-containing protein [Arthrobacter sp. ov118]|nr:DUF2087 domain-containing protein [Arthrobacter sp. ov118]